MEGGPARFSLTPGCAGESLLGPDGRRPVERLIGQPHPRLGGSANKERKGVMRSVCLSALALLLGTACTGHSYTMAKVELDPNRYETLGQAEIKTTGLMLFGFIPIQNNNKIERAANHILEERGGDEIVNISVTESWFWAYVLNGYQVKMAGTVVKKRE
jgi:hypothetical protein